MNNAMKPGKILRRLLVSVTIAVTPTLALGEDIDLFLGLPATAADAPNVLFILSLIHI
mgnify:CR=1 FL=1